MDTKIYLTGLVLMVSWLILDDLKTRLYALASHRKIKRLVEAFENEKAARKKKPAKKK